MCLHSDLGPLGMAVNRRAIEREFEILKAAGVNAIRTSHNPPSPEFLEAANRLGFLVLDETFDMWRIPKVPNGYSKYFDEWSERDARDMAHRDHNHPSIILWSIGNEVGEQGRPDGWQVAKRLVDFFHAEDPTRLTTAAFDNWQNAIKNKLAETVDIPGFNYKPEHYEEILKDHPDWLIYGSETASTVSSRGVYHLPLQNYGKHPSKQVTSYDVVAPFWANPRMSISTTKTKSRTRYWASSSGPASIIWASRPRTRAEGARAPRIGRRAVPISAWWTWMGSPRTGITCTRAAGPRSRWCICSLPGIGARA